MYMWDCIMILLYYTCYEYFIMICDTIGYCLYWDGEQGRREEATHGYSKYIRRPRVRTAFLLASMTPFPARPAGGRCIRQQLAAHAIGSSRGSPTE